MNETKKVKVPNYTPEQTATIVAAYTANPTKETVAALAVQFNKTTRSIVAKLSREGVYKKAEYVAKSGQKPETKESKVQRIAEMIGTTAEMLGGLEAATKGALDLVIGALQAIADEREASERETEENATA